ncbi:glycoside hydrolase N-terminal domain-containing protein [Bacteroides sp. 51]|uniref:glycoside hydrolase N-terminal domain-containing protein n=1 Tax=Bacteroides sp. 51 TaxID=2302938 RepID=UPI001EF2B6C9|nr:glycoside hydrolase N-terminal domain-containing protein [Bacteroides sp. 51]
MKFYRLFFFLLLLSALTSCAQDKQNEWQYYFDQPATIWEESVPLGNGRIGMMVLLNYQERRVTGLKTESYI